MLCFPSARTLEEGRGRLCSLPYMGAKEVGAAGSNRFLGVQV